MAFESMKGARLIRMLLRLIRFTAITLLTLLVSGAFLGGLANAWVLWKGRSFLLQSPQAIPPQSVGLVLGTSPGRGKSPNPFFEGRMKTAAQLYHSGHLYHLVLSGDNRRADYNEPFAMRDALRHLGVPDSAITLDYAGLRTLDSVVRANRVFALKKPVIVTDDFHQARALFLARAWGYEAVGFASAPVPWRRSYKTRIREWASRIRACLDVYILGTQPRFLGKTIQLPPPPALNAPRTQDPASP
ncbi:MAG: hypothetical protein RLZZ399_949 [Verrucomicrobiota bacterium]|jgi:SanA protein